MQTGVLECCGDLQERVASWSTTARRGRAETAAAARRLPTASGAGACRDMSAGRAPTTSTSVAVGRVKTEERASTLSAVIGKFTYWFTAK